MPSPNRQPLLARLARVHPWRRVTTELFRPLERDAAQTELSSLTLRIEGNTAILERGGRGKALDKAGVHEVECLRVAQSVYAETPSADARIELLATAAAIGPRVEVHAPISTEGTHAGRLAIDLPRRALRALGVGVAEPGDRFEGGYAHAFFDDEALVQEGAHAGLSFVHRRGAWAIFERRGHEPMENAAPFALELARVLLVIQQAERLRSRKSPEEAVTSMRARGRAEHARGPLGRARLKRAIGWADALFPGGGNCLRRVLVELSLDEGAATEPLAFGLDVGGTGHVAFADAEDLRFDVVFKLGAPDAAPAPAPALLKNAVDATAEQRR